MNVRARIRETIRRLEESPGPIEGLDESLVEATRSLIDDVALANAVLADVDRFVDKVVNAAAADIAAAGGDISEVGEKLASAYLAGLTKGLALAVLACDPN